MSRKNAKKTTATPLADRQLHSVRVRGPQDAPSAEDKVRSALGANPGTTSAALAIAAGVGKSTAGKILARWHRDGLVDRTTGDSPRHADTWTLIAPPASATDQDPGDTEAAPTERVEPTEEATDNADLPDSAENASPATDAAETTEVPLDTTGGGSDTVENDARPSEPAETVPDEAHDANATATPTAASETPDAVATPKERLGKGALRALVEDYLTAHPGESFGPTSIGRELGRSQGAVNNALEKMVTDGYAIKTCEAPKRFAINPEKTDLAAPAPNCPQWKPASH